MAAPNSEEARSTKPARVSFLETWALDHPNGTIEEARQAIKARFGMAIGTREISDVMKMTKALHDGKQVKQTREPKQILEQPRQVVGSPSHHDSFLHDQILEWSVVMKAHGVKAIEVMSDGRIRVELAV